MENKTSIIQYISEEAVSNNIKNTLGDRTPQFIASVAALVNTNPALQECDRKSLLSACLVAAALDLPINQSLGFAYIIPYNGKAQFQLGYKGFIQLAQRSGKFKTINATDVREGEIAGRNLLTGEIEFNWQDNRDQLPVIGYVSYMELKDGFTKSYYMSVEELNAHASKYSKSYKMSKGMNIWRENFEAMATKTVIKLLLSKYAPMTSDMQIAQQVDQAVILGENEYEYIDNERIDLPEPEVQAEVKEEDIAEVMKNI